MKPVKFIYLSQADVIRLNMSMDEVIPIIEKFLTDNPLAESPGSEQ